MKKTSAPPAVGGSSLLVIFAVLCLTVFALLGLSTVRAEGRLCEASADAIKAYYEADCEAEKILANLRRGIVPEDVSKEGNIYSYECAVSDVQKLVVEIEMEKGEYKVLRWQLVSTTLWQEDDGLKLWDGSSY